VPNELLPTVSELERKLEQTSVGQGSLVRRLLWRLWAFFCGPAQFTEDQLYSKFRYQVVILIYAFALSMSFFPEVMRLANVADIRIINVLRTFVVLYLIVYLIVRGRPQYTNFAAYFHIVMSILRIVIITLIAPGTSINLIQYSSLLATTTLLFGGLGGALVMGLSIVVALMLHLLVNVPNSVHGLVTFSFAQFMILMAVTLFSRLVEHYQAQILAVNRTLYHLATRDPLTGLLNARAFYDQCGAKSRSFYALLFVDLDHFKSVNDRFGHDVGDLVLQKAAQTMTGAVRPGDLVGRIGGEEFCVLLPETDAVSAAAIAETIRQSLEQSRPEAGCGSVTVTASIGVAVCQGGGAETLQAVLRSADEAMYRAKAAGRNRVVLF